MADFTTEKYNWSQGLGASLGHVMGEQLHSTDLHQATNLH